MPRVLSRLRIDEISAVDKAANDGVKVTLFKRDEARERSEPLSNLANLLAEGSTTTKRKDSNMSDHFVEVCKRLGDGDPTIIVPSEQELTAHIQKYASDSRRSGESAAAAFNRIYNAQDDEGLALRRAVRVAKRAAGYPV
jgi:hypothetical protein